MSNFFTPKELAKKWEMSSKTLANWRCWKVGPGFEKIGWAVVYPAKEIKEYEAEHPELLAKTRARSRSIKSKN